MRIDSSEFYNAFASSWEKRCFSRRKYFDAVDGLIIDCAKDLGLARCDLILDLGCGPGTRALTVSQELRPHHVVLVDNSEAMCALASQLDIGHVINAPIHDLSLDKGSANIQLCLWNVLGHVGGFDSRLRSLFKMKSLLHQDGVLFIDVNNRQNVRNYDHKWATTYIKLAHRIPPIPRLGDVCINIEANGEFVPTVGHQFSASEMDLLFRNAGLNVLRRWVVDYDSGEQANSSYAGHLLYCLSHKK